MRMHEEARAELVAVRDLNRRIDALLAEQSKLRQRLFSLGGGGQSEPVSGTKESDLSGGVAKLVDMSREIDDMIDEYVENRCADGRAPPPHPALPLPCRPSAVSRCREAALWVRLDARPARRGVGGL